MERASTPGHLRSLSPPRDEWRPVNDRVSRKTDFPRDRAPRHRPCAVLSAVTALLTAGAAEAGPPFVTDDPEPAPYGHVEAYLFTDGALYEGRFGEAGTGLEINYGAVPDLQLSAAVSVDHGPGSHLQVGAIGLGSKYRFIQEDEDGWQPQASFYPQVEFSLGSGAEEGATRYLLPLWMQKSFGGWTVFGGGGYRIDPGPDRLNSWLSGLAVERAVGERLSIGLEVYGETRDAKGEPGLVGLGLGATRELDENFDLLGSVGPVFKGGRTDTAYYLALGWHR
jgi:hypothetical protein